MVIWICGGLELIGLAVVLVLIARAPVADENPFDGFVRRVR